MRVILIRHGKAADAAKWAAKQRDEAQRPLTRKGLKEMRDAARGLTALVEKVDVLAGSPLVRAHQTAEILSDALGGVEVAICKELEPGRKPERLIKWLRGLGGKAVVMVVGHEPGLSRGAGLMLSGESKSLVEMKKGGACLIEFDGEPAAGRGVMRWLMTAAQLRRMKPGKD